MTLSDSNTAVQVKGLNGVTKIAAGGFYSLAITAAAGQFSNTVITPSANPSTASQSLTLTVTVTAVPPASGTPSGTVLFRDGVATLAAVTLNGSGQATYSTTALFGGSHSLSAVYGGNSSFAGSIDNLKQIINTGSKVSNIAIASSVNPSVTEQLVIITNTVTAVSPDTGTPTGTVLNSINHGTTLDGSGQATCNNYFASLNGYNFYIYYSYCGDANFAPSTSTYLIQTNNQASTTMVVTPSQNPSSLNQPVTFTATVSVVPPGGATNWHPSGTVTFKDGTAVIGTGTLNTSGQASFATSSLSSGSHAISAVYAGDIYYAGNTSSSITQTVNCAKVADFDADGKTDISVYRPSNGLWVVLKSGSSQAAVQQWGIAGDTQVAGDYDGDGKADYAVYRPSNGLWIVLNSGTSQPTIQQWGTSGDTAVPGDYNGDGKTDFAVYRPSNGLWIVLNSGTGIPTIQQWGANGDTAVPGDYNGDGKTDMAVYRPTNGLWIILPSGTSTPVIQQWGIPDDVPVP